ncbi:MAG: hypothetical protein SFV54_02310 [Bryobacteraceae bacterium]|nr:hypothetical protein [Bryobacteraceae bacterium]
MVRPHPYVREGEPVKIAGGVLDGIEGIVLRVKNSWRLVVSIQLLQRSVAVELDSGAVAPVRAVHTCTNRVRAN